MDVCAHKSHIEVLTFSLPFIVIFFFVVGCLVSEILYFCAGGDEERYS